MSEERKREINWGAEDDAPAPTRKPARGKLARLVTPAGERLRGLRVTEQQAEAYCKQHRAGVASSDARVGK